MASIRLLIVDDHRLFRRGLCQLCETERDLEVVGEAENGRQAVRMVRDIQPDVILMDVQMPLLDGVQATRVITGENPAARVIILTVHRQDSYVFEAIKAGAQGYLLKDVDEQVLFDTIRSVHRGEVLLDPELAARVLDEFRRLSRSASEREAEQLTQGEMDVLRLVSRGDDNRSIAEELGLSERTVGNRLRDVYQKLHVNNRTQAAIRALRRGWVTLGPDD